MQLNINIEPIHVVCVLDESGSMAGSESKVVQSFNEIISQYSGTHGGEGRVSLYTFGIHGVKCLYKGVHIKEVQPLTENEYKPGGGTPLYDAIGKAIEDHRDLKNVFFVVDTDGAENMSKEYSLANVKSLIEAKTELGWDFTFVGADLSQDQTAAMSMTLGLQASSAMAFSKSADGYTARSAALTNKLEVYAATVASKVE